MKLEAELEGLDLEGFDFFGMAAELPAGGVKDSSDNKDDGGGDGDDGITGATEYDAGVFGDEEFRYECPKCGFRFN